MIRKYELTDESIKIDGHVLYRIKALRSFGLVREGDLGGRVESKDNLSHEGYCWVYKNARVYGNAQVYGNVQGCGNARVYGNAKLSGNIYISGNARIYGDVYICITALVRICGDTKIDHGIWVQGTVIDNKICLVSTTLEKVLIG